MEPMYQNQTPYGRCKCGMTKLKQDGKLICPACDTKSKPSGLVNNLPNLGPEFFKKVVRMGADGQQYEDMVFDKAKFDRATKGVQATRKIEDDPVPQVQVQSGAELNLVAPQPTRGIAVESAIATIQVFFDSAPAKNAVQFKKLQKIRKTIEKLHTQMTEFLGG